MKALVITSPGGDADVLHLQDVDEPEVKDDEVLIKISATSVNRADIAQRRGAYPPPKGAPSYLGLDCSGIIGAVGKNVEKWKVGDEVCALLGGGGYAEKVAVPSGHVLPVPKGISLQEAAGLPEVVCTVWSTVFMTCHLSRGENLLVHGGSSGVGTFAIQIAKYYGARVFVTVGSDEKVARCKELGADVAINYKTEDFVARVKEETGGKGVDVILDNLGGPYLQRNLDALGLGGRLFHIAFQEGFVAEIDLFTIFRKRLTIQAAGLRGRSAENKGQIISDVHKHVWPALEEGKVKPVIHTSLPLSQAAEAHRIMESRTHIGKILLIV